MSGIGQLAGTVGTMMFMSSKKAKHNIKPVGDATEAIRRMPAKEWSYKGQDERHVGPMAEDMKAATGKGDGKRISLPDMQGVTLAAVQEMDKRMTKLEKRGKR
jgi:hypothetical protein